MLFIYMYLLPTYSYLRFDEESISLAHSFVVFRRVTVEVKIKTSVTLRPLDRDLRPPNFQRPPHCFEDRPLLEN